MRSMQSLAHRRSAAFTFLEIMAVVVVLGILAAIVVPRMTSVTDEARSSALKSSVSGIRAGIGAFRSKAVLAGTTPYPTPAQLTTLGVVLQQDIPENPFSLLKTVQTVSKAQADARTVLADTTYGWNYFVDNAADPPVAIIYANSATLTTIPNGSGGFKKASEL